MIDSGWQRAVDVVTRHRDPILERRMSTGARHHGNGPAPKPASDQDQDVGGRALSDVFGSIRDRSCHGTPRWNTAE